MITAQLKAQAVTVKTGTLVDATVIASASKGDGEARWVKHRSKPSVHGYKAHVGADADTALVEEVAVTPANVHDGKAGDAAVPADPGQVFADSAYRGEAFAQAPTMALVSVKARWERKRVFRVSAVRAHLPHRCLKSDADDPLEDRFVSGLDPRLEPLGEVRRFEVINGALGRRRWTADDRARIVGETLEPGAVVSEVARRHGLTPQQVFTWRRGARKRTEADTLAFVPVVVSPEPEAEIVATPRKSRRLGRPKRGPGRKAAGAAIEVEAAGVRVRIGDGASPALVAAVIGALKGAP